MATDQHLLLVYHVSSVIYVKTPHLFLRFLLKPASAISSRKTCKRLHSWPLTMPRSVPCWRNSSRICRYVESVRMDAFLAREEWGEHGKRIHVLCHCCAVNGNCVVCKEKKHIFPVRGTTILPADEYYIILLHSQGRFASNKSRLIPSRNRWWLASKRIWNRRAPAEFSGFCQLETSRKPCGQPLKENRWFHCLKSLIDCLKPWIRRGRLTLVRPVTGILFCHKYEYTIYPKATCFVAGHVRLARNGHSRYPKWRYLLHINKACGTM